MDTTSVVIAQCEVGWYAWARDGNKRAKFLHEDGLWRSWITCRKKGPLGYFESKEKILQLLGELYPKIEA